MDFVFFVIFVFVFEVRGIYRKRKRKRENVSCVVWWFSYRFWNIK